jgi:hypothetical protein
VDDSACLIAETFGAVLVAKSALEQKLSSISGRPYTRKDILGVFSAIVNSGCGYVPYSTLVQTDSSVQVDKMIDQNIIQYRPEAIFYTDLQPFPETSVVTATGMHALRAMEALLLRYPSDIIP